MDDRRHPERPFEPGLVESYLAGRRPRRVERMALGRCNSNFKLVLDDGEVCVLRLYARGSAEQDRRATDRVRSLVPVPEVLRSGDGWALLSFLVGTPLVEVPEHVGAAAESLARIASVVLPGPGRLAADGSVEPFSFGGVRGFVEQALHEPEVRRWLGDDRRRAVDRVLTRERRRLDELDSEHRLVHGDFNPTNVLVHEGRVGGVLDWEYAHSGSPWMDVANLLRHLPERASGIREGLVRGGLRVPHDWLDRTQLVDLTSHLEFLTSDRSDAFKRECVARVECFLDHFSGRAGSVGGSC